MAFLSEQSAIQNISGGACLKVVRRLLIKLAFFDVRNRTQDVAIELV